jgi:hypothetical protein
MEQNNTWHVDGELCGVPCLAPPQSLEMTMEQFVTGLGANPRCLKLSVVLTMNWLLKAMAELFLPLNIVPIAAAKPPKLHSVQF